MFSQSSTNTLGETLTKVVFIQTDDPSHMVMSRD